MVDYLPKAGYFSILQHLRRRKEVIYFDHAAASMPTEQVLTRYFDLVRDFGGVNAESAHLLGERSRKALEASGRRLISMLKLPEYFEVLWFPGTVPAFSFVAETLPRLTREVYTSGLSHPSIPAIFKRNSTNFKLLKCDRFGQIKFPSPVESASLAVFHQLQSEIGTQVDFKAVRTAFPDAVLLSDSVQAAGKIDLPAEADIIVISGSKFGSPCSGAALFFNSNNKILRDYPILYKKWRSSDYHQDRLHVPELLIIEAALGAKLKGAFLENLKVGRINRLIRENAVAMGAKETIPYDLASPYICHLNFPGFQGGVLARMFSENGVMLSSGSACASESNEPSPALRSIGFKKEDAYSGLRLSFAASNEESEARRFLQLLPEILKNY